MYYNYLILIELKVNYINLTKLLNDLIFVSSS